MAVTIDRCIVVHVVAWAREVIVYTCARSSVNQVVVG